MSRIPSFQNESGVFQQLQDKMLIPKASESIIQVSQGDKVALPATKDYINFLTEKKMTDLIPDELLMFSDKVKKTNMLNWS